MRTFIPIVTAAILLVSTSCQRELANSFSGKERRTLEFTASFEDTKTAVAENGSKVYWSPEDEIKIFQGKLASGKFTSQNEEDTPSAIFKGTMDTFMGAIEEGGSSSYYTAVYPYQEDSEFDTSDNTVSVTVPDSYNVVVGTFPRGSFPSLAKSTNLALAFYNICGGIIFTVSHDNITMVEFSGNNGEYIAGTAKTRFNSVPEVAAFTDGKTSISVRPPFGDGCFTPGVDYYIPTYPTIFDNGFTLSFYVGKQKVSYRDTARRTIRRSSFARLRDKDAEFNIPVGGEGDSGDGGNHEGISDEDWPEYQSESGVPAIGDIVLAHKIMEDIIVVSPVVYQDNLAKLSSYEPIGVVAWPQDYWPDNKLRVMSLTLVDKDGNPGSVPMNWGPYEKKTPWQMVSMKCFKFNNKKTPLPSIPEGRCDYGNLACEYCDDENTAGCMENPFAPNGIRTYYDLFDVQQYGTGGAGLVPYPFTVDGHRNEYFSRAISFSDVMSEQPVNCLVLDIFDGYNVCRYFLDNGSEEIDGIRYDAFNAADNYSTKGIHAGEWYLPSLAESCIIARKKTLINSFNIVGCTLTGNMTSCIEYNRSCYCDIVNYYRIVARLGGLKQENMSRVRPFAAIDRFTYIDENSISVDIGIDDPIGDKEIIIK